MIAVFFIFFGFKGNDCIKIIYLEEEPTENSQSKIFFKQGLDQLDTEEMILEAAESDLRNWAIENNFKEIKIFIIEKSGGEIATESQHGKIGSVKLLILFN
jgi:IS4 transposase